jgi:hypothetical protein
VNPEGHVPDTHGTKQAPAVSPGSVEIVSQIAPSAQTAVVVSHFEEQ